jgi:hypothetical protein
MCIVGILAWVFIVGRVEQVNWGAKRDPAIAATSAEA